MRVALATCRGLPDWEVDDRPLHEELARHVEVVQPAWDAEVDWSRFDAVLIRTTWDYSERLDEFVAWAEHVGAVSRLFNPAEVVRWNTDKTYLRELQRRGVPMAPTVWISEPTELAPLLEQRGWAKAFLKPVVGASARLTLPFTDPEVGQAFLDRCLAAGERMMLQPYLARVEQRGEISALLFGGELSHGVRKIPVPGDYRVQDDYGATDQPEQLSPEQVALVERIVAALPFPDLLYARVDLLEGDQGELLVTEIELVEPSLFLRHSASAAGMLTRALLSRLEAS
jgi:glutathione synthase/RimK-type ligase-like ATP-grasp enzyme